LNNRFQLEFDTACAGATAAEIGLAPAIAVGGLITISLSPAWWWIFPAMRNVNMYGER